MMHRNDIEDEVDAIRDKIYSVIKDMTSRERVEYINARAREIMEKHVINANADSTAIQNADKKSAEASC